MLFRLEAEPLLAGVDGSLSCPLPLAPVGSLFSAQERPPERGLVREQASEDWRVPFGASYRANIIN